MQDSSRDEQFVLLKVAEETYAIPIRHTQEILRYKVPKKLPHSPAHVLGVINLRGHIVPIIGLRQKFSLEDTEVTAESRIVVTTDDNRLIGLLCDSVERVVFIPAKNLEENPEFTGKRGATSIRGVAHLDDVESVIFLLSLAHLAEDLIRGESTP